MLEFEKKLIYMGIKCLNIQNKNKMKILIKLRIWNNACYYQLYNKILSFNLKYN